MNPFENLRISKEWCAIANQENQKLLFFFTIDGNGKPHLMCDDSIPIERVREVCRIVADNISIEKCDEVVINNKINPNLN
jgi:hypothetical protein